MRLLVLAVALLIPAIGSAAPFCVVDDSGREDCGFYSMESCRDSARFYGGACFYRPENGTKKADANPWDFGGAVQRGLERGEARRQARELHDLEVAQRQADLARTQAETSVLRTPSTTGSDADRQKFRSDCDFLYRYAASLKEKGDDIRGRAVWADFKDCRAKYEERWPDGKGDLGTE